MMSILSLVMVSFGFISCFQNTSGQQTEAPKQVEIVSLDSLIPYDTFEEVVLSEDEWKNKLSEQEYYVIRKKGTERPFTHKFLKNKDEGIYTCKACSLPLFSSSTKFKSGTGWPSFYDELGKEHVQELVDDTHGMRRVEIICGRCKGHLGHVFEDGPEPTRLRYCVNGVSLDFVKLSKSENTDN